MDRRTDPSQQDRPRILLADDHPGVVAACRRLLEPSFTIVGHVVDGREVVDTVKRTRPQVALLDLNLPGVHGLECCRRIKDVAPATMVIMLTATDDAEIRERAFELGASAFVVKYRVTEDLFPAIEKALGDHAEL